MRGCCRSIGGGVIDSQGHAHGCQMICNSPENVCEFNSLNSDHLNEFGVSGAGAGPAWDAVCAAQKALPSYVYACCCLLGPINRAA